MKEDKLDIEIAASLKEKLVVASVPYKLGAWEGFQKKRALRKRKIIAYWASGIAATFLLIAVGLNALYFSGNEYPAKIRKQLAGNSSNTTELEVEAFAPSDTIHGISKEQLNSRTEEDSDLLGSSIISQSKAIPTPKSETAIISSETLAVADLDKKVKQKLSAVPFISAEAIVDQMRENSIAENLPLIAISQHVENENEAILVEEELVKDVELVQSPIKTKFVSESDFPIIPKDKTTVGIGMGLTPGFGSTQTGNQVAKAATIGLGMLVDIKLPGKFSLGSGVALNYLNQQAEQENVVMAFGRSYPQTEKLAVSQMQVEVPVFVKYPVTRNNSISVQAGFSNYYALNQTASQENTSERQLAFYSDSDALGTSSVSLRQQSVTESTSLESKSGKFYPFATLNFGVNLRVLETKGANYVIMPFYNHQLKQISGYGDTYGLFGASFKMNFGGKEK